MLPSIGPVTARKVIKAYGSAELFFREPAGNLEQANSIGSRLAGMVRSGNVLEQATRELEFAQKHRISVLGFDEPGYPRRLGQCPDAPLLLFSKGNQDLNPARCISVVGTRKASSYGRNLCMEIIAGLADLVPGLVITSGLAYGIDSVAHGAALKSGLPTFAVLGHGLKTIYPHSHRDTAAVITDHGALITDFTSAIGPERNNFLRRNRIIAGLADATLVVESAERGGALTTAEMTISYNRDLLAVPGRVGDELSAGCNNLIKRTRAALTETAEDVLMHLNWIVPEQAAARKRPPVDPSPVEKRVLRVMARQPDITPDDLSNCTGIPVGNLLSILLEMELKSWISSGPGHRYRSRIQVS